MKKAFLILLITGLCSLSAFGQESGNRNYNRNNDNRKPPTAGLIGNNGELFIEAYVLLNAQPDEFVAVFGVSQEAPTAVESNEKVNEKIDKFLGAAARLGVNRSDTFVDFITQNRVYNFSAPATDGTIRETLGGFETKKTIALRYKDRALLEKLVTAASQASIFDLIKVDYVINDMTKIRSRLFEEAVRVVKQKEENYIRTLGLVIKRNNIFQETYDAHYPAELYQTYTAYEAGAVESSYDSRTRVVRERKSSTSYLELLDRSAFDSVINSVGIEPVVQCTLFLRVKYVAI
ncbi:MAG: SIMPL domain-containing protein [Pyrinomonadaceae bacterium]